MLPANPKHLTKEARKTYAEKAQDMNPIAKKTLKGFGIDIDAIGKNFEEGVKQLAIAHDALAGFLDVHFAGYHAMIHAKVEALVPVDDGKGGPRMVPRDNQIHGDCMARCCEFLFKIDHDVAAYEAIKAAKAGDKDAAGP